MTNMIDDFDRKILHLLQIDTTLSMDAMAEKVGYRGTHAGGGCA